MVLIASLLSVAGNAHAFGWGRKPNAPSQHPSPPTSPLLRVPVPHDASPAREFKWRAKPNERHDLKQTRGWVTVGEDRGPSLQHPREVRELDIPSELVEQEPPKLLSQLQTHLRNYVDYARLGARSAPRSVAEQMRLVLGDIDHAMQQPPEQAALVPEIEFAHPVRLHVRLRYGDTTIDGSASEFSYRPFLLSITRPNETSEIEIGAGDSFFSVVRTARSGDQSESYTIAGDGSTVHHTFIEQGPDEGTAH
jgi:hypothetical protein